MFASVVTVLCVVIHSTDAFVLHATITSQQGGSVSSYHPGVTLDWWLSNDPTYGYQWGNNSILTIDFESPKLIALGQGLAPGVLRLGGPRWTPSCLQKRKRSVTNTNTHPHHLNTTAHRCVRTFMGV
eukprot:PhF_6_TR17007/c0_g1_i1/m.25757